MRSLEAVLKELVDRVSPGDVRLNVPRPAWMREYASYEVCIQTRSFDECFSGKTIGDAIRSAAEGVAEPIVEGDRDPIVPSWYRASRMQRELVERTLERHRAKHMANAAAANIANNSSVAQAEYAMADAFKAALMALEYEDNDEQHGPLEKEPLAARDQASKISAKSRDIERGETVPSTGREARVAATVKELRDKNRARARAATAGEPKPTPPPSRKV
jgi:hypothetical protein